MFTRNGELVIIISTKNAFLGSIRTKLFLSLVAIGIVPLLLLTMLIFNSMRQDSKEQMSRELLRQANTISTNLSVNDYLDTTQGTEFLDNIQAVVAYRFLVLNKKGDVVYDSNKVDVNKFYSSTEVLQILKGSTEQIITDDDSYLTCYVPIHDAFNGEVSGLVMMIGSTAEIEGMISRLRSITSLILLAIVITVILLNVYFSNVLSKPIRKFLHHIRRVTEGHINERIRIKGNVEIEEISDAFNDMLGTIEEIDQSRQQFVANVSHELKTPLSSMKVLAEALLTQPDASIDYYKEFMEDISSEVDRETQIINDLLTLVTLDRTDSQLNLEPIDVNRLIEQVMRMLKPVAERDKITLEIKSYRDIVAMIDETKIYLVLMNLIENAIKYNHLNGKVTVSINADHRDMIIKVTDTGIGIPQDSVNKVFERFYRVDKTRSRDTGGTGLGLNIVHKTVLMHGGSIKCSSIEDQGTTFTVRLPLTQVVMAEQDTTNSY